MADNENKKERSARSTFYYEGKRYEATGKDPIEAAKKAALKLDKLKRGEIGMSGNMTVKRYIAEWLETYKKGNVTDKVYKDYQQKLAFVSEEVGSLRLKDVKDIQLQKILNHFAGYSTDYVIRLRQLIQGMFKQARISRLIVYDPAESLSMPKTTRGSHRSITDFEREHILHIAETHVAGLWVKTMLYCGLRPGETIPLKWLNIDFEKARINISEAKESGSNVIKDPKSEAGKRQIPIPAHLLEEFRARRGQPFDYVFPRPDTNIIHTETSLKYYWKSFKKQVDISMGAKYDKVEAKDGKMRKTLILSVVAPDLTPYCMRHTYGTDLETAGVPINVAKSFMGHSDISTTGNVYTHMTDTTMDANAALIDKFHGGAGGKDGGKQKNKTRKRA